METCSNCGAVARSGAKFCTTCGSRLTAPEAPVAAGGWQQPSQTVDQGPETAPDVVVVSAPRLAGETETGTAASDAETGVAVEPQGSSSSASSWTWGSSTEEEPDTREDSGSGAGADAPVQTTAATNVTAVGDSVPVAWSWNAHAADADDSAGPDARKVNAGDVGDVENGETGTRSDESTSASAYAEEPSGSSKPWSWGASEAEPASDAPVKEPASDSASRAEDASSTQSATGNDVNSASSDRAGSTSFESTQAPNEPVDIDVSSAFNDPNDGDETLSSWAARWNETETESEEPSADSNGESSTSEVTEEATVSSMADADIDFTQRSPLEGAPGGELPIEDVAVIETETETTTESESATKTSSGTGIEGAPGGYEESEQTSDAGIEGAPGGYAQDPADDVADDVASETTFEDAAMSADQDDEVVSDHSEEPTGSFGTEVTPGTDSDLVDPLVGMQITPVAATPPAAVESFESTAFETDAAPDSGANGSLSMSARERAEQLIDELRGLIQSIAGSEASPVEPETVTAGGPVVQPAIDELEAARPSAGQFDKLRTALENARSNRRDVDTMLDLVGRVDDLIALLDAQDRLDDAVGHAIGQLKGDVTGSADA
jgi:hypothetical protein